MSRLPGLAQLDKYLAQSWRRAGLPWHAYADCTQSVYATLLDQFGRTGFDNFVSSIAASGIAGAIDSVPDRKLELFRAIDRIRKRAKRARGFEPLYESDTLETDGLLPRTAMGIESQRADLREAIAVCLDDRQAKIIIATLEGHSIDDIASRLNLSYKTVANEKTRIVAKLRAALA